MRTGRLAWALVSDLILPLSLINRMVSGDVKHHKRSTIKNKQKTFTIILFTKVSNHAASKV